MPRTSFGRLERKVQLKVTQRALNFGTMLTLTTAMSTTAAAPSWAQASEGASNQQRAIELFNEARRLQNQGRPAEACSLFRRSAELLAGPGILLNLAQCFEREGNPIKALETYEGALAAAEQHRTATPRQRALWADEARRGIDGQRRQVTEVVLRTEAPGLSVELDGTPIQPRLEPYRVLVGRHRLTATAPGRVPYTRELTAGPGETESIVVPELEPESRSQPAVVRPEAAPVQPLAPEAAAQAPFESKGISALPWVLVSAGSAVVGAGVVTGLMTSSKAHELKEHCPGGTCPADEDEPGWQDKIDTSKRLAQITNVLWAVGVATAGVGVTLLILSNDDDPEGARSRLDAGCLGGTCGVLLRGGF